MMVRPKWKKSEAAIRGNELFINKYDNDYRVVLFRLYPSKQFKFQSYKGHLVKEAKTFNNKSLALSFAKKYMRKH